ncbi:MAG: DUF1330 domain-containing protein [Hyphomicrobiaceae bacterium]
MTAYLLVDLDIHDQEGFQAYRSRVPEFIAKHGGEYLVRGGSREEIGGYVGVVHPSPGHSSTDPFGPLPTAYLPATSLRSGSNYGTILEVPTRCREGRSQSLPFGVTAIRPNPTGEVRSRRSRFWSCAGSCRRQTA